MFLPFRFKCAQTFVAAMLSDETFLAPASLSDVRTAVEMRLPTAGWIWIEGDSSGPVKSSSYLLKCDWSELKDSSHIFCAIGKDLNQRCISQEFQGCICWCHSRLFWAYSENLCVFCCSMCMSASYGPYMHLWQPTSKGSSMINLFSRIP